MVRWFWVNFQFRGVLPVWIIVGQGPIALALGAGCLDIFSLIYHLSSFSLSLGDGLIQTEILSQRAVTLETTNQPTLKSRYLNVEVDCIVQFSLFHPKTKQKKGTKKGHLLISRTLISQKNSYQKYNSGSFPGFNPVQLILSQTADI